MPPGDDYKEWQDRYDDLNEEERKNYELADDDPNKWTTAEERNHAEDMRVAASLERSGREAARGDWGEDADEGHDDRIQKVTDLEQLAANKRDHLDGKYDYAKPMQDGDADLHQEVEEENNNWQGQGQGSQEGQNDDGVENEEAGSEDVGNQETGDEEAGNEESSDMDISSDDGA